MQVITYLAMLPAYGKLFAASAAGDTLPLMSFMMPGFYCHFNYYDYSGNCNVLHQYSYDDQETEPGISQLSEIAKTGCAFMQHPVFFYIKHSI